MSCRLSGARNIKSTPRDFAIAAPTGRPPTARRRHCRDEVAPLTAAAFWRNPRHTNTDRTAECLKSFIRSFGKFHYTMDTLNISLLQIVFTARRYASIPFGLLPLFEAILEVFYFGWFELVRRGFRFRFHPVGSFEVSVLIIANKNKITRGEVRRVK